MKTTTQPTCQPVHRGFGPLPCPCCGEEAAGIMLDLDFFESDEALTCRECEGTFSLNRVREFLAKWQPVLAWVDSAPVLEEES